MTMPWEDGLISHLTCKTLRR